MVPIGRARRALLGTRLVLIWTRGLGARTKGTRIAGINREAAFVSNFEGGTRLQGFGAADRGIEEVSSTAIDAEADVTGDVVWPHAVAEANEVIDVGEASEGGCPIVLIGSTELIESIDSIQIHTEYRKIIDKKHKYHC